MGAAASVESHKPIDASDIRESGSLLLAKSEIMQLRASLGKYSLQAGFGSDVIYDASDLCEGMDEDEDFNRCLKEISHIRQCLKLSTQSARRAARSCIPRKFIEEIETDTDAYHNDMQNDMNSSYYSNSASETENEIEDNDEREEK